MSQCRFRGPAPKCSVSGLGQGFYGCNEDARRFLCVNHRPHFEKQSSRGLDTQVFYLKHHISHLTHLPKWACILPHSTSRSCEIKETCLKSYVASHRTRGDAVVLKTWPNNAARHAAPHPTLFKGSPHSLKTCVNLTTVIYLI